MAEELEREEELADLTMRRILVALDASLHSMAALRAAADLAALMNAELIGLFVEDINLLRLASLPFAREVRWPTATGRDLDPGKMERDLRLRASRARRALALVADQAETTWTFRVVRGQVTQEVLMAAADADLLSLGRVSHSLGRRRRLGSTARAVATRASRPVFVAHTEAASEQPILVTFDGSEQAAKGLAVAVRLAQAHDTNIVVAVVADNPEQAPALAEQANQWLKSRIAHTKYRYLPPGNGEMLEARAREEDCGLVIIGGQNRLLERGSLQEILNRLDCPVMVVR